MKLASTATRLYFTHQNMAELWNAMTRPSAQNGFGLSAPEANRECGVIEREMMLLADTEAVYKEWRALIVQHRVLGAKVYDARLPATVRLHHVSPLMTFNVSDFRRFGGFEILHPLDV